VARVTKKKTSLVYDYVITNGYSYANGVLIIKKKYQYKGVITLDKDEQRKMHEHMAKVTEAITKINHGERLNDEDIREIFKSLMNAQMMVSDTSEKLEKEFDKEIKVQRDRIDKLEDFLFRDYSKDKE
jgi:hypothetical protein